MEQTIKEIKKVLAANGGNMPVAEVDKYLKLFREKGISVMALEELLNFYSDDHVHSCDIEDEAFVLPSEAMRTSYDEISQEYKELQYKNAQTCKRLCLVEDELRRKTSMCRVLALVSSALAVLLVLMIIYATL